METIIPITPPYRPCRRTVAAGLRMLASESRRLSEAHAATGSEFLARFHTSCASDYASASRRLASRIGDRRSEIGDGREDADLRSSSSSSPISYPLSPISASLSPISSPV